jgi:putative copper export protein
LPPLLLALSYFLHLIGTLLWVGGLLILLGLVMPAARKTLTDNPQLDSFYNRLRKRFFPLTNLSLALLLFTGLIQMSANPNYDGMLQFDNDWSKAILFKHIAFFGMIILGLVMQYSVTPSLERTAMLVNRGKGDVTQLARLRRRENRLAWATLFLGIAALAFTAWATAL